MAKFKKFIFLSFFLIISTVCFAQSFDYVEQVINTKDVTFLQVVILVSQDLNLQQSSDNNSNIVDVLVESYPKLEPLAKKYYSKYDNPIEIKDFSQIICTCYDIKTSLMYIIFGSPRYAFRQLIASGYFPMTMQPNAKLSGVKALSIIADFGENEGESK